MNRQAGDQGAKHERSGADTVTCQEVTPFAFVFHPNSHSILILILIFILILHDSIIDSITDTLSSSRRLDVKIVYHFPNIPIPPLLVPDQ